MGVGDENGNATFWDTRNLREQLACLSLHQDCLRALVFAPQGARVAAYPVVNHEDLPKLRQINDLSRLEYTGGHGWRRRPCVPDPCR